MAERKLTQLAAATTLEFLKSPPGNHLELLKRDREGQYSIRINQQWRVCFVWSAEGLRAAEETSAAKCPQRSIFRRLSAKYLDIGRRKRQKLSSLGPLFASTPSAAQTPYDVEIVDYH